MSAKRLIARREAEWFEGAAAKARRMGLADLGIPDRMDAAAAKQRAELARLEGLEHARRERPINATRGTTRRRRDHGARRGGDSGDDDGLDDPPPARARGPPLPLSREQLGAGGIGLPGLPPPASS